MRQLLAVAAALLGALLFLQWKDWPPGPSRVGLDGTAPVGAADTPPSESQLPTRLAPLEAREAYASVNERTLFRPQRKPPEPEPAQTSPEPDSEEGGTLEGLDLSAVVIAPETTQAWVSDPAQGFQRLRPGDLYQGWTVKDITPDNLVLERQGKTTTLVLQDFSQASPSVVEAPAPAPATRRQMPAAQRGPQTAKDPQSARPDRRVAPPRPPPSQPPPSPASPQARSNASRPFPHRPE
jgi:general secretion pathway protein N